MLIATARIEQAEAPEPLLDIIVLQEATSLIEVVLLEVVVTQEAQPVLEPLQDLLLQEHQQEAQEAEQELEVQIPEVINLIEVLLHEVATTDLRRVAQHQEVLETQEALAEAQEVLEIQEALVVLLDHLLVAVDLQAVDHQAEKDNRTHK